MDKVGIEAREFDFLFGRSTSRSMGTPLIDTSSSGMYVIPTAMSPCMGLSSTLYRADADYLGP
jgi:hypothetical protein